MQSSINGYSLQTLTPARALIGTAFLRHGEPTTLDLLGIGANDPTIEPTSRWKTQWPGGDDIRPRLPSLSADTDSLFAPTLNMQALRPPILHGVKERDGGRS